MDTSTLLSEDWEHDRGWKDRIPFVVSYHPALDGIFGALSRPQPTLDAFEEHQKLFPSMPLIASSRPSVESPKDTLVVAKIVLLQQEDPIEGCYRCCKARCQICQFRSERDKFISHVTDKEHRINSRFYF